MNSLNRREFIRLCTATGAALGLSHTLKPEIIEAFSGPAEGKPAVIWLQGGSCSGCTVSLLNSVEPDIAKVLTDVISLKFHQTLMSAAGESAINVLTEVAKTYKGNYYVVVEGAVPVGAHGLYATLGEHGKDPITFETWIKELLPNAKGVIAVGTCSAFGGIPAAGSNPTGSKPVSAFVNKERLINIPGCPTHPDRILGTLVHLIKYGMPELDALRRPVMFFGKTIHDLCERRPDFDKGIFAKSFADSGCLYKLGCKGPMAFNDCPIRKYNNGTSWCVGANSPCLACAEPEFPDGVSPFLEQIKEYGVAGTPSPKSQYKTVIDAPSPKPIANNIIGGGK